MGRAQTTWGPGDHLKDADCLQSTTGSYQRISNRIVLVSVRFWKTILTAAGKVACLGGSCRSPVSDGDSLDQDDGDGDGENWTSVRWDL